MTSTVRVLGSTSPTLGSYLGGVFCWVFSASSASWITARCWSLSCKVCLSLATVISFGSSVLPSDLVFCAAAGIDSSNSAPAAPAINVFMTVLPRSPDQPPNRPPSSMATRCRRKAILACWQRFAARRLVSLGFPPGFGEFDGLVPPPFLLRRLRRHLAQGSRAGGRGRLPVLPGARRLPLPQRGPHAHHRAGRRRLRRAGYRQY